MITLHPFASYEKTAHVLDWALLVTQLRSNLMLMRSFTKIYDLRDEETGESGWSHHTVGLFWSHYELHLAKFSVAIAREMLNRPLSMTDKLGSLASRRNKVALWTDLQEELEIRGFPDRAPPLIGKPAFHSAVRAYLKYREQQRITFRMWKRGLYPDHACHRDNPPRRSSWVREDYIRIWDFFGKPPLRWYSRWNWREEPDDTQFYLTEDRVPIYEREKERKAKRPLSPEAWKSYNRGRRMSAGRRA